MRARIIVFTMTMVVALMFCGKSRITVGNSIFINIDYNTLHAEDVQNEKEQEVTAQPSHGNALLQVMGVVLFVWLSLSLFLFRIDRKISHLEKDLKELPDRE